MYDYTFSNYFILLTLFFFILCAIYFFFLFFEKSEANDNINENETKPTLTNTLSGTEEDSQTFSFSSLFNINVQRNFKLFSLFLFITLSLLIYFLQTNIHTSFFPSLLTLNVHLNPFVPSTSNPIVQISQTNETKESSSIAPLSYPAPTLHQHKTIGGLLREHNINCQNKALLMKRFPQGVVVEVGAYDGAEWEQFVTVASKLYSYEPTPESKAMLEGKAAAKKNFVIFRPAACTDSNQKIKFYIGTPDKKKELGQQHSVYKPGFGTFQEVEVPGVRLDTEDFGGQHINLLKIDTQGHEYHILKGAEGLLNNSNPIDVLHVEFSPGLLKFHGVSGQQLLEYIYSFGYMCFDCAAFGPPDITKNRTLEKYADYFGKFTYMGGEHGAWTDLVCVI